MFITNFTKEVFQMVKNDSMCFFSLFTDLTDFLGKYIWIFEDYKCMTI